MIRNFLLTGAAVLLLAFGTAAQKITTRFETSGGQQTPEYKEIISWWQRLDQISPLIRLKTMGMTDAGYPLHLITVSTTPVESFEKAHQEQKTVILINNGIHPGEPDGIDASMLLARDIVEKKLTLPPDVVLAIIPVYNIGGCLNRSTFFRVDQNGPEAFGSRGNSQNLDLNRDFIKCDTKDALAFSEIFHLTDPDIFIDNHVSNGADYQHVMTLLTSQHQKLGGKMGAYLNTTFEPALYRLMKNEGFDLLPYLNDFGESVTSGWSGFWDSPRYGSGYATLFHSFAFIPETHMLKPYPQRVSATYALMKSFIRFAGENGKTIRSLRQEAKTAVRTKREFPAKFRLDSSVVTPVTFRGYAATRKESAVSGLPRLYYDRSKPFTMQIPYYNTYREIAHIIKPKAYIIPQGWWKVIDRLKINKVEMRQLPKDTTITVAAYYITRFRSSPLPYQAHHINQDIEVTTKTQTLRFRKGDWLIPMNQVANRFLIETLEPCFEDSYFAWNFFDGILNRKEWYSAYNYDELAARFLKENAELKKQLDEKRKNDPGFAKSTASQLTFIFENSPYSDQDYMRYPVFRINE